MIKVRHSQGSYPVRFEPLADALQALPQDAFIVTDENVSKAVGEFPRPTLVLPPGEQTKSLIWLEAIASWLVKQHASRKSAIVAVGGGVMGDLVGFAAATYMRGVPFVQVPTTLLAMVDSSVGGKVAVDLAEGKNLVGAFYPPRAVYIDVSVLKSLSKRQFRNGMAEVWKYGFIMDPWLVQNLETADLQTVIERCIQHKANIVEEDEFETKGLRATLNYGHTVGHAIEQLTGYKTLLHGEAISIGMVIEAKLGELLGITEPGTTAIVADCLNRAGLPTVLDLPLEAPELVESMRKDKKATSGRLAFSLLTQIGGCKLVENVGEQDVVRALKEV